MLNWICINVTDLWKTKKLSNKKWVQPSLLPVYSLSFSFRISLQWFTLSWFAVEVLILIVSLSCLIILWFVPKVSYPTSTCVWIELRKSLLSRKDKLGKKHSFKKNTNLVYSINGQVHHSKIIMKRERESYNVIDFIITKVFIYFYIYSTKR